MIEMHIMSSGLANCGMDRYGRAASRINKG